MAYAYHQDRGRYFEHQRRVTSEYVIPFIEESGLLRPGSHVLEIGCGEAGVLKAFIDRGDTTVGVDRNAVRLARGQASLSEDVAAGRATLLNRDAHTLLEEEAYRGAFELIVMKDVIEHIDDRPQLLQMMTKLLRPGGKVFLAFPPWRMPFGGHQQICKSWLLSRLPYFHLLPGALYSRVLAAAGEAPARIESLLATKRTGIGITQFEDLVARCGYRVVNRRTYLLNPMYSYRFGLPPFPQLPLVTRGQWVQDFVTTCAYFTIEPVATA